MTLSPSWLPWLYSRDDCHLKYGHICLCKCWVTRKCLLRGSSKGERKVSLALPDITSTIKAQLMTQNELVYSHNIQDTFTLSPSSQWLYIQSNEADKKQHLGRYLPPLWAVSLLLPIRLSCSWWLGGYCRSVMSKSQRTALPFAGITAN